MEIINALPSANIYISLQIVVGWIIGQKRLEKDILADQSAHGATNQLVELNQGKRQIIDILKWQMQMQKNMLMIKFLIMKIFKCLVII